MADSIVRLKVDSQEYDNKLKRAAEQLNRYADGCRKAGGTLEHVDEGVLEFTRSLGRMETTANTARGKLAEMTKAFTDMSVQYKNMTEEEKKGEFGKALNASLTELKGRIQESKVQLDDVSKSLNSGGGGLTGALDNLAGKFGMSVQSLASWGTALAAAKGALDVAKDAFFASEATVDEWGRVMDSSKSLYEGFLTALNTGDISGYLSRIDSIVQAARAAYNELDRLGTMKTIQAPQMSAQQTENERMRMMIQTGRYIAPVDGRRASMQNGQLLTPEQIKRIEQQLQGGMQKVVTLVENEVHQTGRAIDAVYNRQAQELGMSLKEFRKGTSSMAEFDKRMAGYQKYEQWRKDNSFTDAWGNRQVRPGNPYEEYKKWNTFRVDGDRYNDLVKLIQQRDQQAGQAYSMQSQAYRTMNRAEGVTLRQIMGGGSGGGGGRSGGGGNNGPAYAPDSIAAMEADVSNLTKLWKEAGAAVRDDYLAQLEEAKLRLDTVTGKNSSIAFSPEMAARQLEVAQGKNVVEIPLSSDLAFDEWMDDIKEKLANLKVNPIQIPIETATDNVKKLQDTARTTAKVVGTIGTAFNAIEDPAAKVAAVVAQAIANVALAYSDALAKTTTEKFNIWSFIAASASAMISMGTTIASIHSATGYAQGGMIKGNSYSGDNVGGLVDGSQLVGLNAGELVLTKAQQGSLAQSLQNNGQTIRVVGKLHGKDLFICAENWSKSAGHGEFVTW